jgi:hypothetical protein
MEEVTVMVSTILTMMTIAREEATMMESTDLMMMMMMMTISMEEATVIVRTITTMTISMEEDTIMVVRSILMMYMKKEARRTGQLKEKDPLVKKANMMVKPIKETCITRVNIKRKLVRGMK